MKRRSVKPPGYLFCSDEASKNIKKKYILGSKVGSGTFATVIRGKQKSSGKPVAVKVFRKADVGDKDALISEVDILKSISHPNIVSFLDVFEDKEKVYIVMEMLVGGELFDRIVEDYPEGYNEQETRELTLAIGHALQYLHNEKHIVHRDLKPENMMYTTKDPENVLKITDFGLSAHASDDCLLKTKCGTPYTIAPEIICGLEYGTSVDMWSFGVITYIILSGAAPFYSDAVQDMLDDIAAANYEFSDPCWEVVSDLAKDFIRKLLVVEPEDRMTIDQALDHPWLSQEVGEVPSDTIPNRENLRRFNAVRKLKVKIGCITVFSRLRRQLQDAKL